jgi:hypothetical protein
MLVKMMSRMIRELLMLLISGCGLKTTTLDEKYIHSLQHTTQAKSTKWPKMGVATAHQTSERITLPLKY